MIQRIGPSNPIFFCQANGWGPRGDWGAPTPQVEAAFDRVFSLEKRNDGSFQMFAETPSGRGIWVIWRYDREDDEIPDVFGELLEVPIFVITAY